MSRSKPSSARRSLSTRSRSWWSTSRPPAARPSTTRSPRSARSVSRGPSGSARSRPSSTPSGRSRPRSRTSPGSAIASVAGAPSLATVMPSFLEFARGAVIVAHNASFDVGFLNANLLRLEYPTLPSPAVCTAKLARRLVWPEVAERPPAHARELLPYARPAEPPRIAGRRSHRRGVPGTPRRRPPPRHPHARRAVPRLQRAGAAELREDRARRGAARARRGSTSSATATTRSSTWARRRTCAPG